MAHFLLRKNALDAVNQEINRPSPPDPRSDKEYTSPYFGKGTEFVPTKMGASEEYLSLAEQVIVLLTRLAEVAPEGGDIQALADMDRQDMKTFVDRERAPKTAAAEQMDYLKLAEAIAGSLELLTRLAPKDGDIFAFADMNGQDLRHFINEAKTQEKGKFMKKHLGNSRFRGQSKNADIKMHNDPKFLPPRNDMRSHLDEEVKKEIDADTKEASGPDTISLRATAAEGRGMKTRVSFDVECWINREWYVSESGIETEAGARSYADGLRRDFGKKYQVVKVTETREVLK